MVSTLTKLHRITQFSLVLVALKYNVHMRHLKDPVVSNKKEQRGQDDLKTRRTQRIVLVQLVDSDCEKHPERRLPQASAEE